MMATARKEAWPMRWDLLSRFRLIEIVALWEGRLTTKHLVNSFGMGRQQASKDINQYLADAPGNLEYDRSLRGYKPTARFKPQLTSGLADEYLHVMSRSKDITHTFQGLDLGFAQSEILQVPLRHIRPEILRPLVRAIRGRQRVEVEYVSMTNPTVEVRVIAPHTLVCTPLRWHVRAYCEKNKSYRDFVLSRFRGESDLMDASPNDKESDSDWNSTVPIVIKPDPRLSDHQKDVIATDYGMTDGALTINTRKALVDYTLRALNLDPRAKREKPEAQQIVVENYDEISQYLF